MYLSYLQTWQSEERCTEYHQQASRLANYKLVLVVFFPIFVLDLTDLEELD